MEVCILQGRRIAPEMPGVCHRCCLYLNTCMPSIDNGYLVGTECADNDNYCDWCPYYEDCGR